MMHAIDQGQHGMSSNCSTASTAIWSAGGRSTPAFLLSCASRLLEVPVAPMDSVSLVARLILKVSARQIPGHLKQAMECTSHSRSASDISSEPSMWERRFS